MKLRVNSQITGLAEVRLVVEGQPVRVVPFAEAQEEARRLGLDLVEVAPNATPPVVKVTSLKEFKAKAAPKEPAPGAAAAAARGNPTTDRTPLATSELLGEKELVMSTNIEDNDIVFKVGRAREFLLKRNSVKFVIKMRRSVLYAHADRPARVQELLARVSSELADAGSALTPRITNAGASMLVVPRRGPVLAAEERAVLARLEGGAKEAGAGAGAGADADVDAAVDAVAEEERDAAAEESAARDDDAAGSGGAGEGASASEEPVPEAAARDSAAPNGPAGKSGKSGKIKAGRGVRLDAMDEIAAEMEAAGAAAKA